MTASSRALADTQLPPASYSFGDGAAPAIWLGLGAARLATLSAGLLVAVGTLAAGAPMAAAAVSAGLAGIAALLPLAGRPAVGWLTPLVAHVHAAVTARGRWCAPPPAAVLTATDTPRQAGAGRCRPVRLRLPAEYGRPHLLEPDGQDDHVCCLIDPTAGTLTVLFDVAGVDRYPLLEPVEQDQLLTGWGEALTWLGRDPDLLRVQLLDRTRPAPVPPDSDPRTDASECRLHDSLTAVLAQLSSTRDSVLAVQFRVDAFVTAGPRRSGAGRFDEVDLPGFTTRARQLAGAVLAAQLVLRPLPADELLELFTDVLTPTARIRDRADRRAGRTTDRWGGLSRRCGWDHVRVQDSWHRSFAVSFWPATPVGGSWLAPLLLASPADAARTLSIHLEPLSAADAARAARAARTRAELDRADRFRLGLTGTAQADRAADASGDVDADLVAGHSALRLSAVLTVTAPDLTGLAEAARQLQQSAATCRLQLRPLHGQHELGLAATLPLCRARTAGAL